MSSICMGDAYRRYIRYFQLGSMDGHYRKYIMAYSESLFKICIENPRNVGSYVVNLSAEDSIYRSSCMESLFKTGRLGWFLLFEWCDEIICDSLIDLIWLNIILLSMWLFDRCVLRYIILKVKWFSGAQCYKAWNSHLAALCDLVVIRISLLLI